MSILQRVVGQQSPTINDLISLTDPSFDLTGCSSHFRMRVPGKSVSAIDESEAVTGTTAPPNSTAATVYTPSVTFAALPSGLYEFWHTVTLSGGAVQDTPEQLIYLSQHAQMPGDLCSIGDVKVAFEPAMQVTTRDARIAGLIVAASQMLNQQLDRELTPQSTALTRRFRVAYEGDDLHAGQEVDLAPYDLRSASSVVLHPESSSPTTLVANTDYVLEPLNAPDTGTYTRLKLSDLLVYSSTFQIGFGYANLDITGNWGAWTTDTVPQVVREACVDTVRSWMRQNPAAYAYAEQNDPGMLTPAPAPTFSIPPGAWKKVQYLKRMWL